MVAIAVIFVAFGSLWLEVDMAMLMLLRYLVGPEETLFLEFGVTIAKNLPATYRGGGEEREREKRKWERELEVKIFLDLEIGLKDNK